MPPIRIRNMDGTRILEAELLTDYRRDKFSRRCVVSVRGETSDAPLEIKREQGHEACEEAVYDWLLAGGRRFVTRPIRSKDICVCDIYKDPADPTRSIYEITYLYKVTYVRKKDEEAGA